MLTLLILLSCAKHERAAITTSPTSEAQPNCTPIIVIGMRYSPMANGYVAYPVEITPRGCD